MHLERNAGLVLFVINARADDCRLVSAGWGRRTKLDIARETRVEDLRAPQEASSIIVGMRSGNDLATSSYASPPFSTTSENCWIGAAETVP